GLKAMEPIAREASLSVWGTQVGLVAVMSLVRQMPPFTVAAEASLWSGPMATASTAPAARLSGAALSWAWVMGPGPCSTQRGNPLVRAMSISVRSSSASSDRTERGLAPGLRFFRREEPPKNDVRLSGRTWRKRDRARRMDRMGELLWVLAQAQL